MLHSSGLVTAYAHHRHNPKLDRRRQCCPRSDDCDQVGIVVTTVGDMVDPQLAAFKSDLFYSGFITRASAFHAECRGFESLRPLFARERKALPPVPHSQRTLCLRCAKSAPRFCEPQRGSGLRRAQFESLRNAKLYESSRKNHNRRQIG